MEETIIKCTNCDLDNMRITDVYNTIPLNIDYPPRSCKYKQGAIVIELTCLEGCGHKQYIVVGQHKGQVFLSQREEDEVK